MAFIVEERIEAYAETHTTPPLDLLARLAQETQETLRAPQMLTGPIEGRFLELLVFGVGARRVLEIGTYSGYSALSMAAGLPPDGRIDTCEIDPSMPRSRAATSPRARTPTGSRFISGPRWSRSRRSRATSTSSSSTRTRANYANYLEAVLPRLTEGALIAIDNTLWSGKVLDPQDEDSRAIAALNDAIAADERLVAVQLTVRDGVTLLRRR